MRAAVRRTPTDRSGRCPVDLAVSSLEAWIGEIRDVCGEALKSGAEWSCPCAIELDDKLQCGLRLGNTSLPAD